MAALQPIDDEVAGVSRRHPHLASDPHHDLHLQQAYASGEELFDACWGMIEILIESCMIDTFDSLEILRTINLSDDAFNETLYKLLDGLIMPIVEVYAITDYVFHRARRGKGYQKRSEVSYVPIEYCNSYQRATVPKKTVFYAAMSDDPEHLEQARAITLSECSKLASLGLSSKGREYISVSRWRILEPLRVACIVTPNRYVDVDNKFIDQINAAYKAKVHTAEENECVKFLEDQFSKNVEVGHPWEYKISAIVSDLLLYRDRFDAVAYPSVKLGGQAGLNFAIRPDVADSKLELLDITEQCFYKNGKHCSIRTGAIYDVKECRYRQSLFQSSDKEIAMSLGVEDINDLPIVE